jgi:hypothetical protein
MASFGASRLSREQLDRKFSRLLVEHGLNAVADPRTGKKHIGFFIDGFGAVRPIGGTLDGVLVFLRYGFDNPEQKNQGAYVVYLRNGRKIVGQYVAKAAWEYDMIYPRWAVLCKDKLIISGSNGWFGNGPQTEVRSYQQKGRSWQFLAKKTASFESWGSSPLQLSKDKSQVLPITIDSRTYPKHLDACHATAHCSYTEKWKFVDGRPKLMWKKLRDTPYNLLDKLYGAIENNDATFIRKSSLNQAIYNKLLALKPHKGSPQIEFPHSICDGDSKVIGLTNLRSTFYFKRYHGRWVVWKIGPISDSQ